MNGFDYPFVFAMQISLQYQCAAMLPFALLQRTALKFSISPSHGLIKATFSRDATCGHIMSAFGSLRSSYIEPSTRAATCKHVLRITSIFVWVPCRTADTDQVGPHRDIKASSEKTCKTWRYTMGAFWPFLNALSKCGPIISFGRLDAGVGSKPREYRSDGRSMDQ